MKTLLIVEDEKAIRAGIYAMVSRSPVAVHTDERKAGESKPVG